MYIYAATIFLSPKALYRISGPLESRLLLLFPENYWRDLNTYTQLRAGNEIMSVAVVKMLVTAFSTDPNI
jgi:hypothetical protein